MNRSDRAASIAVSLFGAVLLPAFLCACFPLSLQAQQVKDLPAPTDYVSDFAHVLSPEATARIDSLCSQLDHSAANTQVAVVTARSARWR